MADALGVLIVAALAAACSAVTGMTYRVASAGHPPDQIRVAAPDGTELTLFSVRLGSAAPSATTGRMLFIGGSGCTSLKHFLGPYFFGIETSYTVYAVQKPGVADSDLGLLCSDAFHRASTAPAILARNRAALAWLKQGAQAGPVTLFGVSEGGGIAVALAAEVGAKTVHRVVVVGSGGMPLRESLRLLARRGTLPIDVEAAFAEVAADPASISRTVFGHSHAYWSSFLDVDPLPLYRRARMPILVLFGAEDESVPVESARHLQEAMAAEGRNDVSVLIVPGADHALRRGGHDLKPQLLWQVGRWLKGGSAPDGSRRL
ncbi:pimeloyl-ACP methyl ester carboxylesterase [Methylobacterium sp. BE186]|uniref:alpha/beta hydrolase family protein n=1 Tax=Methylobacterium sp. BE186 TaxID=2817715 RepID=UPI002865BBBA|nr:alpha/beta hydrolase [Methylobacterium sp. BE186]MDR7038541.1 pimeloyl-ACP methyl ester carboxylesterase [Methylobacterium sp. BE186]